MSIDRGTYRGHLAHHADKLLNLLQHTTWTDSPWCRSCSHCLLDPARRLIAEIERWADYNAVFLTEEEISALNKCGCDARKGTNR